MILGDDIVGAGIQRQDAINDGTNLIQCPQKPTTNLRSCPLHNYQVQYIRRPVYPSMKLGSPCIYDSGAQRRFSEISFEHRSDTGI